MSAVSQHFRHVRSTPDSGPIAALPRTVETGHERTFGLERSQPNLASAPARGNSTAGDPPASDPRRNALRLLRYWLPDAHPGPK